MGDVFAMRMHDDEMGEDEMIDYVPNSATVGLQV